MLTTFMRIFIRIFFLIWCGVIVTFALAVKEVSAIFITGGMLIIGILIYRFNMKLVVKIYINELDVDFMQLNGKHILCTKGEVEEIYNKSGLIMFVLKGGRKLLVTGFPFEMQSNNGCRLGIKDISPSYFPFTRFK